MTELEEVLLDIENRIQRMMSEQMERYFKSGKNVALFLATDQETAFTKRMQQLIDTKFAIMRILGR